VRCGHSCRTGACWPYADTATLGFWPFPLETVHHIAEVNITEGAKSREATAENFP
jgi:hypothetical protein